MGTAIAIGSSQKRSRSFTRLLRSLLRRLRRTEIGGTFAFGLASSKFLVRFVFSEGKADSGVVVESNG
jgi:hypothetical protein